MKKGLSEKEKVEIILILGAVLVVAIIGLIVTQDHTPIKKSTQSIAGQAIQIDKNRPSTTGILEIMNNLCAPTTGSGDCNSICGLQKVCVPIDNNCDDEAESNQCLCCDLP
jgi:hypothetical protein